MVGCAGLGRNLAVKAGAGGAQRWLARSCGSIFAVAALLALATPANAVDLPGAAEPARIQEELEMPVAPRATPGAEPGLPEQDVPFGAEEVRFVLQNVAFDGATVYSQDDLRPLWADLAGQEVSLMEIYDVARAATVKYRTDGYILSQVIVPPQDVEAGMVTLRVIEGFIDQVTVEGKIAGRSDILRAYGDKIRASRPLLASDLERYLLLAGDLAGVTARGVLTPSPDVPGASNLAIVVEHDYAEGFARADNRGSRFIGPWLFVLGGSANSVIGQYEKITLIGATAFEPEELQYAELSVEAPVDYEGTVVRFAVSGTGSHPGHTLETADIDSDSYTVSLEVSHPFIRTREENLSAGLVFELREVDTKAGGDKIVEDSLRVLRAFGTWDFVDTFLGSGFPGVNLLSGELSQGLDIFGATDKGDNLASRDEGDGEFTKFVGTISRLQGLGVPGLNLYASATGQVSSDPLLSSEEFGVGGAQFGRGYDPSEITGDHGYATTVELQYGNPVENVDFLQGYQIYAFWDYGEVFNDNAPGTNDDAISLMSAGGGIRINFIDQLSGNFEVAQQLHHVSDSSTDGDLDTRFLFGLTGRF